MPRRLCSVLGHICRLYGPLRPSGPSVAPAGWISLAHLAPADNYYDVPPQIWDKPQDKSLAAFTRTRSQPDAGRRVRHGMDGEDPDRRDCVEPPGLIVSDEELSRT